MRPEGLVKCLHIHLAHELGARQQSNSGGGGGREEASPTNLVGHWTVEALKTVGVDGL